MASPVVPRIAAIITTPVTETERKPRITPGPAEVRPIIIIAVGWRINVERRRLGIDRCPLDVIARRLGCGEDVLRAALVCPHRRLRRWGGVRHGQRGGCSLVLPLVEHRGQHWIGHALLVQIKDFRCSQGIESAGVPDIGNDDALTHVAVSKPQHVPYVRWQLNRSRLAGDGSGILREQDRRDSAAEHHQRQDHRWLGINSIFHICSGCYRTPLDRFTGTSNSFTRPARP